MDKLTKLKTINSELLFCEKCNCQTKSAILMSNTSIVCNKCADIEVGASEIQAILEADQAEIDARRARLSAGWGDESQSDTV